MHTGTVPACAVVADLKSATPESGISNPLQQHVLPSRGFQIPSNRNPLQQIEKNCRAIAAGQVSAVR